VAVCAWLLCKLHVQTVHTVRWFAAARNSITESPLLYGCTASPPAPDPCCPPPLTVPHSHTIKIVAVLMVPDHACCMTNAHMSTEPWLPTHCCCTAPPPGLQPTAAVLPSLAYNPLLLYCPPPTCPPPPTPPPAPRCPLCSDDINIVAVLKAMGAESDQEVVQLVGHDEQLAALLMPSIQVCERERRAGTHTGRLLRGVGAAGVCCTTGSSQRSPYPAFRRVLGGPCRGGTHVHSFAVTMLHAVQAQLQHMRWIMQRFMACTMSEGPQACSGLVVLIHPSGVQGPACVQPGTSSHILTHVYQPHASHAY
jgi:hypothetical protein